jgi:SAM-dependent methyltransferase
VSDASSYAPAFFEPLFAVEDRHFWFRARNDLITAACGELNAGRAPGYHVLEIGCGNGNVLRALERACPGGVVIGMDLFKEGLGYARRRTEAPLLQGDMHRSPFGARFQLVALFDVLEHMDDDLRVLRDLHGLLADDGYLVLTVPAGQELWSYFDEAAHHRRRYDRASLSERLGAAGYEVVRCTPFMLSLYPLVWAGRRAAAAMSRLRPRGEQALAVDELRVRPGLNELILGVLRQEIRQVAAGRDLPLGTSLLAVARRGGSASG